jgi:EPS-associated MarR family transcriptional regulator
MSKTLDKETHYRFLNLLEQHPELSQREVAKEMGVSVGKVNYCIKALVNVGHLKLNNFMRSDSKVVYVYLLTPKAISEKTKIAQQFLKLKLEEHERLAKEINVLKAEVQRSKQMNNTLKGKK